MNSVSHDGFFAFILDLDSSLYLGFCNFRLLLWLDVMWLGTFSKLSPAQFLSLRAQMLARACPVPRFCLCVSATRDSVNWKILLLASSKLQQVLTLLR